MEHTRYNSSRNRRGLKQPATIGGTGRTPRAFRQLRRSTSLSLCPAVLYGDHRLLRLGQITSEHERRAFTYENTREVK
jgi:hypothetical protein